MSLPLKGMKVLVAGATGEVGRGAAFSLSQAGAIVTVVGRSHEKLSALSLPGEKHIIATDYSTVEGTKELAKAVADQTFDVVVASSGPWWPVNELSNVDPETLKNATAANFLSQMNLFSVLATRCKGQYLMVNGAAAKGLPSTGLTGVLASACVGASVVMSNECVNSPDLPDYSHVLIDSSVGHAQFRTETIDPNEFGRVFVAMALKKHQVDAEGTILVDDACYERLVSLL